MNGEASEKKKMSVGFSEPFRGVLFVVKDSISMRLSSIMRLHGISLYRGVFPLSLVDMHVRLRQAADAMVESRFDDAATALDHFFEEATYEKGWDFGTAPCGGATKSIVDMACVMRGVIAFQKGDARRAGGYYKDFFNPEASREQLKSLSALGIETGFKRDKH